MTSHYSLHVQEYPERLMLTYKPEEDIEPAEDGNASVDEAKPEPTDDLMCQMMTLPLHHCLPHQLYNSQDPDYLLVICLSSFVRSVWMWLSN